MEEGDKDRVVQLQKEILKLDPNDKNAKRDIRRIESRRKAKNVKEAQLGKAIELIKDPKTRTLDFKWTEYW